MTIFEQIHNGICINSQSLYAVSPKDLKQMMRDFNFDKTRIPIHPMHQFYIDKYGETFQYEKYIECVLNWGLKTIEYRVTIDDQVGAGNVKVLCKKLSHE